MALEELLDSESTSHEWPQSCVSRTIQIDLPVAHHTEIFEGACVGELCAIKEKGRQTWPEAHHLSLDFWVFTVKDFFWA
jgi:hypothetical protein